MDSWYVLFSKTGYEQNTIQSLKLIINKQIVPFMPLCERTFQKAGIRNIEKQICFPGYIFVRSELPSNNVLNEIRKLREWNSRIYRMLKYDAGECIALADEEKAKISSLLDNENCIRESIGVIVGDRIVIREGPLKGYERNITKINRHKREAYIMLNLLGASRNIVVGLEVIDKQC